MVCVLVCSWEGERSHVDQAVDKEREENRKRHWSDNYEEDLDAGKVKEEEGKVWRREGRLG